MKNEIESGKIIFLSGTAGTGKTTLAYQLINSLNNFQEDLASLLISVTTRPIRKDEKEGIDYYFVDENEFSKINGLINSFRAGSIKKDNIDTPKIEIININQNINQNKLYDSKIKIILPNNTNENHFINLTIDNLIKEIGVTKQDIEKGYINTDIELKQPIIDNIYSEVAFGRWYAIPKTELESAITQMKTKIYPIIEASNTHNIISELKEKLTKEEFDKTVSHIKLVSPIENRLQQMIKRENIYYSQDIKDSIISINSLNEAIENIGKMKEPNILDNKFLKLLNDIKNRIGLEQEEHLTNYKERKKENPFAFELIDNPTMEIITQDINVNEIGWEQKLKNYMIYNSLKIIENIYGLEIRKEIEKPLLLEIKKDFKEFKMKDNKIEEKKKIEELSEELLIFIEEKIEENIVGDLELGYYRNEEDVGIPDGTPYIENIKIDTLNIDILDFKNDNNLSKRDIKEIFRSDIFENKKIIINIFETEFELKLKDLNMTLVQSVNNKFSIKIEDLADNISDVLYKDNNKSESVIEFEEKNVTARYEDAQDSKMEEQREQRFGL